MKKADAMALIVKTMNGLAEKKINIKDEVQAEYDFLLEEYQREPKDITGEDIQHFLEVLLTQGLLSPSEVQKGTQVEHRNKSNKKKEEVKEEMSNKKVIKGKETSTTKKGGVKTQKATTPKKEDKKRIEMKTMEMFLEAFPEEIEHPDYGTLTLRNDITSLKDMADAIQNEENLVIVNYWHPRMLRMFDYDPVGILEDETPDKFEMNLDVLQPTYCSENVLYAISMYTEVNTTYTPDGFEPDENNLRYNGFINYQVYEMATEE